MKKILIISICMLFAAPAFAQSPNKKSKFYDFGEQVIDGEMKKPTALYVNEKRRVEFDRLLRLKRSFLSELEESGKDNAFR